MVERSGAMSRKPRDYKGEYARRIAKALAAGKTPHQARGHHPKEKPAQRIRKKSLAYKLGAAKIPSAQTIWRNTFSHAGETRKKRIKTTQETYRLSHLYPNDVAKVLRKAARRVRTLLYGATNAPRVQWRLIVMVQANYPAPENGPNGEATRSTPWKTVTKTAYNYERLVDRMTQACFMYVNGPGELPEAVIRPLALYLDRV